MRYCTVWYDERTDAIVQSLVLGPENVGCRGGRLSDSCYRYVAFWAADKPLQALQTLSPRNICERRWLRARVPGLGASNSRQAAVVNEDRCASRKTFFQTYGRLPARPTPWLAPPAKAQGSARSRH